MKLAALHAGQRGTRRRTPRAQPREVPEPGAIEKELVRLSFRAEPKKTGDGAPIDAQDVLTSRGKVDVFDVERKSFPNEHDELLERELPGFAKPALDDVVFEDFRRTKQSRVGSASLPAQKYTLRRESRRLVWSRCRCVAC